MGIKRLHKNGERYWFVARCGRAIGEGATQTPEWRKTTCKDCLRRRPPKDGRESQWEVIQEPAKDAEVSTPARASA